MERRGLFSRWWGRVAIAALALLILAAGLCLFDLDQGHYGADDHVNSMDLCFLVLVAPPIAPLLAGLLRRGLAASIAGPAPLAVALPVPYPPPRRPPPETPERLISIR
jgi:hypothetical protein